MEVSLERINKSFGGAGAKDIACVPSRRSSPSGTLLCGKTPASMIAGLEPGTSGTSAWLSRGPLLAPLDRNIARYLVLRASTADDVGATVHGLRVRNTRS